LQKINKRIVSILLLSTLLLNLPIWQLVPSGQAEPAQPLTLHSQNPLVPIHMHGPSLQPVHMHSLAGIVPIDPPVPYTLWHELYPTYCQQWVHTDWEDNGNGILDTSDQIEMTNAATEEVRWYHVDRVTMTIFVSTLEPVPEPEMYVEFKGSYIPEIQPLDSSWHGVWPIYSGLYHIINWQDTGVGNTGYLGVCDSVMFAEYPGVWWHVDDYATDLILNEKIMDPIGILWHELYPTYCKNHSLTSWEESPGDLYPDRLSPGDQIDMNSDAWYWNVFWSMGDVNRDGYINLTDLNRIVAKYGWTGPPGGIPEDINSDGKVNTNDTNICSGNQGKNIWTYFPGLGKTEWYYVDRVTLTLLVSNYSNPAQSMYIEYKGPFETMYNVKTDPIESLWHEIYPIYCPVYEIVEWEDNCNGVLSYCDNLTLFDLNTQAMSYWHVEELSIDIILNEKITDPTCTYWKQLYPQFGSIYHIIDWTDDGDELLSPRDEVTLNPGPIAPYVVTDVTLTLNVSRLGNPAQTMYIEFASGFEHLYEPKTNPVGTMWYEVYPDYEQYFEIGEWIDNCNGVLSYCDIITLIDMAGFPTQWHVEELAIDITVQELVHDVSVTCVTPLFASVFQGWPDPITVFVSNDGDFTETFNVDVKYGGIHVTTSPITVSNLPPKTSRQLTFCWVTKNVPPGIYTITAYANPVPGETDLADNSLTDGTVTILRQPDFYWKEGFCDYAPSGVPDFDQKQWGTYNWTDKSGAWSHCGPVAVANSLWWLDSKFEPAQPPVLPPAISDGFPLVSAYLPGIDDHDPANVPPLVEHLAYLMDTDGRRTGLAHSGTNVVDMEAGLAQYLSWTGVNPKGDVNGDGIVNNTDVWIVGNASGSIPGAPNWNMAADIYPITLGWPGVADNVVNMNDALLVAANLGKTGFFYECTVNKPDYYFIEEEVEKSEDVVLLIGYWYYNPEAPPGYRWYREGGHYLTVAGVNSTEMKIAVSDPCLDAFEFQMIPEGRVPIPHVHMPPEPPYITHNDAAYVSHDIYNVALISQFPVDPNPNGTWTLVNYAGWKPTPPYFAVIESAVITSPAGVHDVAVINVTTSKTGCVPMPTVCEGYNAYVYVTVENQGDFTETFNVTVYANTTSIATQPITLTSGNSTTLTFTWNTTGFAKGNYTIWAYAHPDPPETDTIDNSFIDGWVKVVIPGNVNGDQIVDMKDITTILRAYGTIPGHPKYNPNADVNGDGVVDMKDVTITLRNYGKTDP